jgi:hemoglobin
VKPVPTCAVETGFDGRLDLSTRTVIHDLVVGFYRELIMDDLLAPVFVEVAEVDWSEHIPLLIDYWCRILLGHDGYQGAILSTHQHVHDQEPLTAEHFDRWYTLWAATIDGRWAGTYAERAKRHAAKMAATLARRIPSIDWAPPPGAEEEPTKALGSAAMRHRAPSARRGYSSATNGPPSTSSIPC